MEVRSLGTHRLGARLSGDARRMMGVQRGERNQGRLYQSGAAIGLDEEAEAGLRSEATRAEETRGAQCDSGSGRLGVTLPILESLLASLPLEVMSPLSLLAPFPPSHT
jgi:hypothetical protein